jgi:serine/threonine-protein kinase
VDARADVYAFGVMAYEILVGELPFKHSNPGALLIAHLSQPPPDPRERLQDLPDSIASSLFKVLAKEPGERYQTAGEFIRELETAQ